MNRGPAADASGRRAQAVLRMHAIAAGLQAAGLDAQVHDTRGLLDICAMLRNGNGNGGGGGKGAEVTVDEDGYVSMSYWNAPGATPAQIITMITRALAAIADPP